MRDMCRKKSRSFWHTNLVSRLWHVCIAGDNLTHIYWSPFCHSGPSDETVCLTRVVRMVLRWYWAIIVRLKWLFTFSQAHQGRLNCSIFLLSPPTTSHDWLFIYEIFSSPCLRLTGSLFMPLFFFSVVFSASFPTNYLTLESTRRPFHNPPPPTTTNKHRFLSPFFSPFLLTSEIGWKSRNFSLFLLSTRFFFNAKS